MPTSKTLFRGLAAIAASLLLSQTASAGLPLVCNPFQTADDAKLLPWAQPAGRNTIDRHYDIERLTGDTLHLLSPDSPTLARMENLRRATIYASKNRHAANALLKSVLERTRQSSMSPQAEAVARFDAAYLVESYRQYGMTMEQDLLGQFDKEYPTLRAQVGALDGYALMQRAIDVTHEPDMEYAASLMAHDREASARHRAAARAGAKAGSRLAANLKRPT
jgi:hypothetical protein